MQDVRVKAKHLQQLGRGQKVTRVICSPLKTLTIGTKDISDAHQTEYLLGWTKNQKVFKITLPPDIFCTNMYKGHFCKNFDF